MYFNKGKDILWIGQEFTSVRISWKQWLHSTEASRFVYWHHNCGAHPGTSVETGTYRNCNEGSAMHLGYNVSTNDKASVTADANGSHIQNKKESPKSARVLPNKWNTE